MIFYFLTLLVTFYSRKVFLDFLGADFVGLTGTLNSILGVLNLAEFGVGNSIAYFLYGPIAEGNKQKINEIVSVCGYMYRMVGNVILCGGVLVSCFFPFWFSNTSFSFSLVYFAFFSILGSALIGYYINYKNQLLYADQKQYLIQGYFQTCNIIKNLLQIAVSVISSNLYLWVALEFLYGIGCCLILNYRIKREYPWLRSSVSQGKILFKKYRFIFRKCKQIVVYSMKNFVLQKSDELFVFAFVSLQMVAFYGNYLLIVNKLVDLVRIPFNGMLASVGNLVAEGDKDRIHEVFWEMLSILYFIASLLVVGIYLYVSPVISIWLGEEYVLSQWIVILLCVNSFICIGHFGVYYFNNAYGNYHDIWASWAEAILNVSIILLTAWRFGIVGILIGKMLSSFLFLSIWKPVLLYKYGFKVHLSGYWMNILRYLILLFIYIIIVKGLCILFPIRELSIVALCVNMATCYLPSTILFTVLYINAVPARTAIKNRLRIMIRK